MTGQERADKQSRENAQDDDGGEGLDFDSWCEWSPGSLGFLLYGSVQIT